MTSRSRPFLENRPSLCSYCLKPVGGLLFRWGDRWYGACSADHLEKIKEDLEINDQFKRGERGVSLKVAQINRAGIEKAVASTKEKYLELAKKNKSFVIHQWERNHRLQLFSQAIKEYLIYCTELANKGLLVEKRENDRSN